MNISLRRAGDSDREFLSALLEATMREYIEKVWGWDEASQRSHHASRVSVTMQYIVVVNGHAAGMIEIDRNPEAIVISNIQIAPDSQGRGIGAAVVCLVIDEADAARLPVALQVLEVNPRARRLYERLGFRVIAETPPHVQMRREHEP
ncbi:MAG: GNAT family N-acetyltransferase [Thermoanaerobaculia bacterium]|nr:GNAT family N-acetyltransferase [Thermoanaerobaculia bacterium]